MEMRTPFRARRAGSLSMAGADPKKIGSFVEAWMASSCSKVVIFVKKSASIPVAE